MPPIRLLVLLTFCLIIYVTPLNSVRAPIQENNYSFTIVSGNSVKADSTPLVTPKTTSLGSFTLRLDIYHLLAQYDWNTDLMYQIMLCESGGNEKAIGDRNTAHHSYGLLQVRNLPTRNYSIEELFDPARNIEIGYGIFLKQGYGAWKNCYNKSI